MVAVPVLEVPSTAVVMIVLLLLMLDVPHHLATLPSALPSHRVTPRRDLHHVMTRSVEMIVPVPNLPFLLVPSPDLHNTVMVLLEEEVHRRHLMILSLVHSARQE